MQKQESSVTCQECGMNTATPTEYHPIEYCVLYREGYDPRHLEQTLRLATVGRIRQKLLLNEGEAIPEEYANAVLDEMAV